jgi:hypothetical protein
MAWSLPGVATATAGAPFAAAVELTKFREKLNADKTTKGQKVRGSIAVPRLAGRKMRRRKSPKLADF